MPRYLAAGGICCHLLLPPGAPQLLCLVMQSPIRTLRPAHRNRRLPPARPRLHRPPGGPPLETSPGLSPGRLVPQAPPGHPEVSEGLAFAWRRLSLRAVCPEARGRLPGGEASSRQRPAPQRTSGWPGGAWGDRPPGGQAGRSLKRRAVRRTTKTRTRQRQSSIPMRWTKHPNRRLQCLRGEGTTWESGLCKLPTSKPCLRSGKQGFRSPGRRPVSLPPGSQRGQLPTSKPCLGSGNGDSALQAGCCLSRIPY